MSEVKQSQKLHWFAVLCALVTLCLIALGGLVTSHGAGMAVPDWPTTYGYNMFYFPISQWVGGIFYEHTHRLLAAFVGLLTSILAVWIWVRHNTGKARWYGVATIVVLVMALGHRGSGQNSGGASVIPFHFKVLAVVMPFLLLLGMYRSIRSKGGLDWLALTAFFAVITQGLLGGFRVALYQDQIGIFHATLAQLFLLLLSIIALMCSKWWNASIFKIDSIKPNHLMASVIICGLILMQLVLGASMRHQHAGLAVADFPLAHGKVWPATDDESIKQYNLERVDYRDFKPITAGQIYLHMAHRGGAVITWLSVIGLLVAVARSLSAKTSFFKAVLIWSVLLTLQAVLGAWTVLSNKAADIATLHVVLGALSFVFGGIITVSGFRCLKLSGSVTASALAGHNNRLAEIQMQPDLAGKN